MLGQVDDAQPVALAVLKPARTHEAALGHVAIQVVGFPDHQKNRYGRYLPQLRKVWEDHGPKSGSFSKWLDDVEANKTRVPGVKEALALTHPETGPVVKPGGVAGGRVVYLDDETRKPYVARVTKGAIAGGAVKDGDLIFVIGPDNKIYAGSKARGNPGQVGAFNHSSFFSGGPVKSAGSLKVSGGRITEISDLSGHYMPTKSMVAQAVRKFGGGDQQWLADVKVKLGTAKPVSGASFIDEDYEAGQADIWGKYSVGDMSRENAARALMAGSDGNWLVRMGSNKKLVISYRKGTTVDQDLLTALGSKGLERKKLLLPAQVTNLLATVGPTQVSTSGGNGQPKRPTSRWNNKRAINVLLFFQLTPEAPTTQQRAPRGTPPTPKTQTSTGGLSQSLIRGMRTSAAWHGDLNRAGAEQLLKGKPGAWLLREGREGVIAFSYNQRGTVQHALMSDMDSYNGMVEFTKQNQDALVTA